ncbi:MAG: hypothetical protein AAF513_07870 [Pseudomonadota bacterium]
MTIVTPCPGHTGVTYQQRKPYQWKNENKQDNQIVALKMIVQIRAHHPGGGNRDEQDRTG